MCFNEVQEMLEEGERFNKFKKGARNAVLGAALGASLGAGGMRYHMNKNVIPAKEKQAIERTEENYNKNIIPAKEKAAAEKAVTELKARLANEMRKGKSRYDTEDQRREMNNLVKDVLNEFGWLKDLYGERNAYRVCNLAKREKAAYDNGERSYEDVVGNLLDFVEGLNNELINRSKTEKEAVSKEMEEFYKKHADEINKFNKDF